MPHSLSPNSSGNGRLVRPLPSRLQPQPPGLLPAAAHPRQHRRADPVLAGSSPASRPAAARRPDGEPAAPAPRPAPPGPGVHAHQPPAGQPAAGDGTDPQPAVRGEPAAGAAVPVAAVSQPPAGQPQLPQQASGAAGGVQHRGLLRDLPVGQGRAETGRHLASRLRTGGFQQNPGEWGTFRETSKK